MHLFDDITIIRLFHYKRPATRPKVFTTNPSTRYSPRHAPTPKNTYRV